jgi:hypothetical protein
MQQHFAFDCGVQAGRDGSNAAEKIFDQPTSVLRDAWIEGYHTGKLMRVEDLRWDYLRGAVAADLLLNLTKNVRVQIYQFKNCRLKGDCEVKNVQVAKAILKPDGGEVAVYSVVVQSGIFIYTFYCRSEKAAEALAELLRNDVAATIWMSVGEDDN